MIIFITRETIGVWYAKTSKGRLLKQIGFSHVLKQERVAAFQFSSE